MNQSRKLELSKETLRCLDDQDLTGVAACPGELTTADGQAGGPGRQGYVPTAGSRGGTKSFGERAGQLQGPVLERTGQQRGARCPGYPLEDRDIADPRVRHAHQPVLSGAGWRVIC
jgi:hypothetical protein